MKQKARLNAFDSIQPENELCLLHSSWVRMGHKLEHSKNTHTIFT